MPFVIGVGVLALLLLALFARDQIRDVRRGMFATSGDYSQRLFWLVVIFCLLLLVGFVSLMVGGVLMLNGTEDAGRAFLILGLCFCLFGYIGEISWSAIKWRAKRRQEEWTHYGKLDYGKLDKRF